MTTDTDDTSGAGLLPCPFCGTDDVGLFGGAVACIGCGAEGPFVAGNPFDTWRRIYALWNTRSLAARPAPADDAVRGWRVKPLAWVGEYPTMPDYARAKVPWGCYVITDRWVDDQPRWGWEFAERAGEERSEQTWETSAEARVDAAHHFTARVAACIEPAQPGPDAPPAPAPSGDVAEAARAYLAAVDVFRADVNPLGATLRPVAEAEAALRAALTPPQPGADDGEEREHGR